MEEKNLEFLLNTLKEATESQFTGTMYDSEGKIIPDIECPEDKYTLHVIGKDFHKQVLQDKDEPAIFRYCPPKKDSNKE